MAQASFLKYVDDHKSDFIKRLADAVAIASVSGDAARRPDVVRMAHSLKSMLEQYGVEAELRDLGSHIMDGQSLELPPAVLGRIGTDPSKRTVLVYGHFDVQPAFMSDGWNTDPFKLVHDPTTDRLYGRGSTDDKGPVVGWINVLQAHHDLGLELPVNIRFCLEGMEESGSEGLDELIVSEAKRYFADVDCVCISDNYWLNTRTPAITYGLRGLAYYKIVISGPSADLHSGVYGRSVHEPMTDLIKIMATLVDSDGRILIDGVDEMVARPTAEEIELFEAIDFSINDIDSAVGASITLSDRKTDVLMGRMREPSLSLHGIEGAFYGVGAKTVIPAKVAGKFSIRLVPPQTPDNVHPLVVKHIQHEFAKLKSKCTLQIEDLHGGKPWVADIKHWNYEAARQATLSIYNQEPNFTREGGSIPVTLTFAENLGVSVLLLPMGRGDDGAHSTNEKLDVSNYIEGTKLLGSYLYEVGKGSTA